MYINEQKEGAKAKKNFGRARTYAHNRDAARESNKSYKFVSM